MRTAVGYVLGGLLALFGSGALLAANSLWMPATNPVSPAAPDFRRDMVVANLAGLAAFALAGESLFHVARKPAVARVLWAVVGTLLCAMGTILLVNLRPAAEGAMESARQALRFQAGVGLAYVVWRVRSLDARAAASGRNAVLTDMPELSRYLFVAGGVPFVLLGLAHAVATPLRLDQSRGLSPRDAGLAQAMSRTSVVLTARTNMWLAWVGFNLSHGLGAVLFGVTVLLIGRSPSSFAAEGGLFGPLAVVVSVCYLVLGIKYWFRTPILACALSVVLFVSSWLLAGVR